uniref:Uncharacterized protein n=1 Tax=Lepeophtheirus salmonis TaxID=72036 RepID=A0A0K2TX30_LEPSM
MSFIRMLTVTLSVKVPSDTSTSNNILFVKSVFRLNPSLPFTLISPVSSFKSKRLFSFPPIILNDSLDESSSSLASSTSFGSKFVCPSMILIITSSSSNSGGLSLESVTDTRIFVTDFFPLP